MFKKPPMPKWQTGLLLIPNPPLSAARITAHPPGLFPGIELDFQLDLETDGCSVKAGCQAIKELQISGNR